MAVEGMGQELAKVVALLGSGVIAVPIFKRLGLGSVLGYLAAGLVIGPFGLRLFTDPDSILHIAELGVVMFLFVIGLEMEPSRLWSLRRDIFGLGVVQVAVCGLLLTLVGIAGGLTPTVSFLAAMGFTLSSTAIVMQILEERGDTATPAGQSIVSILLLEDLAIVPLLGLVAFLAPAASAHGTQWMDIAVPIAALLGLLVAGRWLLNPMFRVLAQAHAREVMTAAALLVVLGAALAMEVGGLSMAMGAFLAGVLLSESTFRHQLEADVEPFRGILLGLFFLGVGMSLDLAVVARAWPTILAAVIGLMVAKILGVYLVARFFGARRPEALTRSFLLAQGGEFAFVLFSAAKAATLFEMETSAILTATVIISMALTPLLAFSLRFLLPKEEQSLEGVEAADGLNGKVLFIGFGRFAQVVSQGLLARGVDVSIIESDTEMIRSAAEFGFKVYYGDGTRLDVLRASGAGEAEAILVCVDKRAAADRIVQLVQSEWPLARLYVRAYDRGHAIDLIHASVEFQIRETFESAIVFGEEVLKGLGVPPEEAAEITEEVRRRDSVRLALQVAGGLYAGRSLLRGNIIPPTPLTTPKRVGRAINEEAAALTRQADSDASGG